LRLGFDFDLTQSLSFGLVIIFPNSRVILVHGSLIIGQWLLVWVIGRWLLVYQDCPYIWAPLTWVNG